MSSRLAQIRKLSFNFNEEIEGFNEGISENLDLKAEEGIIL